MKASSVNFNTPSPMESKHRRFVLLRKSSSPGSGNVTDVLERKISMRSTKDQLVKKDVLMPVKHNVFLNLGCRRDAFT
ncbi:hypothetical protein TNCV_4854231 [Trichonephila clavipes]|nr:hypothetical protein TNCV_4854231 [Trichonephila clavipes]